MLFSVYGSGVQCSPVVVSRVPEEWCLWREEPFVQLAFAHKYRACSVMFARRGEYDGCVYSSTHIPLVSYIVSFPCAWRVVSPEGVAISSASICTQIKCVQCYICPEGGI